ncbi:hypothetical protein [uncultured Tenacibaculum sp.]|uniref:hypothetical protein n=1 Tax=uncultured Tenacibaculum sp. TaxID=174713 RepID=UPI00260709C9|nr:hypothetical protein [uncultured Tenacibaculum sp.]
MNHYLNEEEYLKVTTYLADKNERKGYGWNIRNMKPMPGELYINKEIETGGIVNLLDGETNNVRGVTNFDKNTLVEGRVFVISSVSFASAIEDAGKAVHGVDYSFDNVPASLRFSYLVVKQNDEVLMKLPINSILNGYKDGEKYRDLGAFSLIVPSQPIEVNIEYPNGTKITLPDGKSLYSSVFFRGFETYLKR